MAHHNIPAETLCTGDMLVLGYERYCVKQIEWSSPDPQPAHDANFMRVELAPELGGDRFWRVLRCTKTVTVDAPAIVAPSSAV